MNWKLSAFYIENHRKFGKSIVVNLGGEFFYKIENLSDNELSILREENEDYIPDFFSSEISLISALVGGNGVGKTTLLVELMTNEEVLLIFENKGGVSVIKNNYSSKTTVKLNKLKFDENNVVIVEKDILKERSHLGINIGSNAFYSPRFSYYNPQALTNYFLSSVATDNEEFKNLLELNAIRLRRALLMFGNSELMDEISKVYKNFPRYNRAIINLDKIPDYFLWKLEVKISSLARGIEEKEEDFDIRLLELIGKGKYFEKINFLVRYNTYADSYRLNAIVKIYIMTRILAYVWFEDEYSRVINEPYIKTSENFDLLQEENVVSWLEQIKENMLGVSDGHRLEYFINLGLEWYSLLPFDTKVGVKEINELIEKKLLIKQQELSNIFFNQGNYIVNNDASARDYFQLGVMSPSYSLSQGEENLMNLLSSFYVNDNLRENRPQILLLDEATIGFHPIWQKKFVNTLVKILPLIFESKIPKIDGEPLRKSKIQIVFTSHDPFPLSDMPSSNIVYLYSSEGKVKEVSKIDSVMSKKSFGANITDLLEDSFFMGEFDEVLIGEFAQEKINGVIRWIEKETKRKFELKEEYSFNKEEFDMNLKVIKVIDEHIVQLKLAEMMDELIDSNQAQKMILSSQISSLETRLNELK